MTKQQFKSDILLMKCECIVNFTSYTSCDICKYRRECTSIVDCITTKADKCNISEYPKDWNDLIINEIVDFYRMQDND